MKFFGAKFGSGIGLQGNSFALPTMGYELEQLPIASVQQYIHAFIAIAEINNVVEPFTFYVTAIGTGIAGFAAAQIAPLFVGAPSNCLLPPDWTALLSTPDRKEA